MASSQPGFPDFLPGKNINIPHGYQTVLLGCPPVVPSVTHLPTVDGVPWIYPGFQGYHFIPYPNSRDMRHLSNTDLKAVSPYHQALLGRVGSLFSPYQPIAAEDHSRVVKAATRESTSPLKAWLNEHIKNPYPTKGEKIMLAIVTKMSLTQVSTWFANARRRLKKENKMSWAEKGKSDEELEEEEEESEEERLSQKGLCSGDEEEIDPQTIDEAGDAVDHRASLSSGMQLMQRLNEGPKEGNDNELVSEGQEEIDVTKSKVQCIENDRLPKPKIWSLAETATSDSQVRDSDKRGDKSTGISEITKFWSDWASRNGQLLSFTDSTKYAPMSNQVVSLNYR